MRTTVTQGAGGGFFKQQSKNQSIIANQLIVGTPNFSVSTYGSFNQNVFSHETSS